MSDEAPKRGRGRPKGSRNKKTAAGPIPESGARTPPSSYSENKNERTTLEYHERQFRSLQEHYDKLTDSTEALPRDFAVLDAGMARHLKAIAELKGETKITEPKIIKSEAWIVLWDRIARTLERFPEALRAVQSELEANGSAEDS